MTNKEINKILLDFEQLFRKSALQFPKSEREDICQEIRIWVFNALKNGYEEKKDKYKIEIYIFNHVKFCLRRLHFDVKVQERFERSYYEYPEFFKKLFIQIGNEKDYHLLSEKIVLQLKPIEQRIFFFLINNHGKIRTREISKKLNIEYKVYKKYYSNIKKIVKNTI